MTEETNHVEELDLAAVPDEVPEPLSGREIWSNRLRYFLLGVAIVCIIGVGYLIMTRGFSSPADISITTYTPSITPTHTATPTITATRRPPTDTPTPGPTHTLPPPSRHQVRPGDTWLGLAIYYDVSLESLLQLNGQTDSDYIQEGTEILIPYPTYTPTPNATQLPTLEVLEAVRSQCREHVVKTGETLIAIAINYEVSVQLIESVNNITDPNLVREGQKLCIPLVTPGPAPSPTFGPSPTPVDEPLYAAPQLLYPPAGIEVPPRSTQVALQWTVVGLLDADEYYMIEVRNLSRPGSRAVRGFAKTTTWTLPDTIQPAAGEIETFAWRVSVVRGDGAPTDSDFLWERTGLPSDWQTFMWMGVSAGPAPTPTP